MMIIFNICVSLTFSFNLLWKLSEYKQGNSETFSPDEKLVKTPMSFSENHPISWDQFRRNTFVNDGQKYSFWEWFHTAIKLTRHHLSDSWKNGYIAGFISRQKTNEILLKKGRGAFMLRFAERIRGNFILTFFFVI